ncbi:hypothetical protein MIR68_000039 [Amoeboaphelidium protococcarum]|nr:hypothetical protein MIR68_000039 [Amoeboaphelidium protococcarum]
MTFGYGGYSSEVLKRFPSSRVFAIDRDPLAVNRGQQLSSQYLEQRLIARLSKFSNLLNVLPTDVNGSVDAILFDLGVSSMQIDDPQRGFSFKKDGPLDMRMSSQTFGGTSAAELVNFAPKHELARIIKEFGEEKMADKIASQIDLERSRRQIVSTFDLARVVEQSVPRAFSQKSVSRVFQALRMAVNEELAELQAGLSLSKHVLRPGGMLICVSFHSLEDRVVKNFMKRSPADFSIATKKPILPSHEELLMNPRSRSAKLRAAIKC